MAGDKTEQPTDHKLKEQRKKGNISKGKDIVGALQFVIGFTIIYFTLGTLGENFIVLLRKYFDFNVYMPFQPSAVDFFLQDTIAFVLINVIPLFAVVLLIGVFANYFQVGSLFTIEPVKPQFKRLNPIQGFKNMFKVSSLFELFKNILKISLSFFVFYKSIRGELGVILNYLRIEPLIAYRHFSKVLYLIVFKISLIYIIISIIDYVFQKKQFMKQMKMSKQEVKDEYKQLEGDPQVKGQRQQLYQEIGQHNMVQDVKNASVVVVNPDEIAIALTYNNKTMNAPRITAKGRNEIAKSIREIAKEYNIPIVTNINLAHSLLELDLGQDVPESLYEAVAEVLRYVHELAREEE